MFVSCFVSCVLEVRLCPLTMSTPRTIKHDEYVFIADKLFKSTLKEKIERNNITLHIYIRGKSDIIKIQVRHLFFALAIVFKGGSSISRRRGRQPLKGHQHYISTFYENPTKLNKIWSWVSPLGSATGV